MPSHPRVTVRISRSTMSKCGFCLFGNAHELCPSVTVNGDGVTLIRCGCTCQRAKQYKCLHCSLRENPDPEFEVLTEKDQLAKLTEYAETHEINPFTFHCFDEDICHARLQKQVDANPTIQMIKKIQAEAAARIALERVARPATQSRPKAGHCVHCGEPTKGGLVRPGHDAAWLSALVNEVRLGEATVEDQMDKLTAAKVSIALMVKFEKRAAMDRPVSAKAGI